MRNLFRIIFQNENKEILEIHASSVENAEIFGLVQAQDIVFMESSELIITPEDDKVKKIFKNTVKTLIPLNQILRIDEITVTQDTPVIRLYENK